MLFIENECYEIFWEGFFILCLELLLVDGLFVVIWIDFVFGFIVLVNDKFLVKYCIFIEVGCIKIINENFVVE